MRDDGTIARLDGGGDCAIVATKGLGVRATADPASPVVGTLAGRARVVAYANDAKATARALLAGGPRRRGLGVAVPAARGPARGRLQNAGWD